MNTQSKITQLEAQAKQLHEELARLKEELAKPKKLEMWEPDNLQRYYFTLTDNSVCGEIYDNSCASDRRAMEAGNCFPTRELAEYYAERREARQRLEMLALAENGMVPYVFRYNEPNWFIFACVNTTLTVDLAYQQQRDTQYFPTARAAERVLDAMSNEDLILLYGVGKETK